MTRSIFDPNSGETERSGSRNLGPDADQISQEPPDIVDGKVDPKEEDAVIDMSPLPLPANATPAAPPPAANDIAPRPGDASAAD